MTVVRPTSIRSGLLFCIAILLGQLPVVSSFAQQQPVQDNKQQQGRLAEPVKLSKEDQDQELADEYYRRDEWAKAAELYSSLVKRKDKLVTVYAKYANALTQLQKWDDLEKLIRKIQRQESEVPRYAIDLALFYKNHNREDKATTTLLDLQKQVRKSEEATKSAAEYALLKGQPVWAKDLYLSTRQYLAKPELFSTEMATVYQSIGDQAQMFNEVLGFLERGNQPVFFLQATLQNLLSKPEEYKALEKILLNKLSADPVNSNLIELLLWTYLQQKDFGAAFIQARALDRRLNQEGFRSMEIAYLCMQNQSYSQAIRIYDYVMETWPGKAVSITAARQRLQAKEILVKQNYPIDQQQVRTLIQDYFNLNKQQATPYNTRFENQRNVALLYGFYLGKIDSAITLLTEVVKQPGLSQDLIDRSKIDLGDLYLLHNEPWEASLTYSQVEKTQKENQLGHEAKLRNARLSYFKGEFLLAQEHLDVLKIATSREIANDALDLSLRIQDNTILDSASPALYQFSKIELMLFCNKTSEAMQALDQMLKNYPSDPITDDVYWLKASTYRKIKEPVLAINFLDTLVSKYPDGVYADDAQFALGQIYEQDLGDKQKAMDAYEQILKKYPSSIFAAEARKRFRILRGDVL